MWPLGGDTHTGREEVPFATLDRGLASAFRQQLSGPGRKDAEWRGLQSPLCVAPSEPGQGALGQLWLAAPGSPLHSVFCVSRRPAVGD